MTNPKQNKTVKINIASLKQNSPSWGNPTLERYALGLVVLGTTQTIKVDFSQRSTFTLGRADQSSEHNPDIDLGTFKARELGVSRQHAQLELHGTSVYITDLASTNATYLNGARIPAHQPKLLRDGDVIWLGQLKLYIRFGNQLENRHLSTTWSTRTHNDSPPSRSPTGSSENDDTLPAESPPAEAAARPSPEDT